MCKICNIDNCRCQSPKIRKYETKKIIKTGANSNSSVIINGTTLHAGDNSFHLEDDGEGNQVIFSNIELVEEEFDGARNIQLDDVPEKIIGVFLNGIRLDSEEYNVTNDKNIELFTGSVAGSIVVQYNRYIR